MKELIIKALTDAFGLLEKQVPQTKTIKKSVSILDIKPKDIISFMRDNDIPDNAFFDGKDNGYDGWNDILLSWDISVPTTDKDKLKFKRNRFTDIGWKFIYELLTNNGYKRLGYNSALAKQFDDTTVYDMFIGNDFDRLVQYYSIRFIKE
jgi:hypothetical protein